MTRLGRIRTIQMVRLALLVLGMVSLTGCRPTAGGRFEHLSTYTSPAGEYRIRYEAPPWEFVSAETGEAEFIIPSNAAAFVAPDVETEPKYQLLVSAQAAASGPGVDAEIARAAAESEMMLGTVLDLTTDFGATGLEFLTQIGTERVRYRRYVWLDRAAGGSIRLQFEATPLLDELEVDAMIAAVEVDVSDATVGGE